MQSPSSHPPKSILRFFRWFCHPDLLKYVEGDLLELYQYNIEKEGAKKAKWLFTWEVLKLFRPSIIRNLEGTKRLNNYGMFKNDLRIAIRNLRKHRTYVLINLLGMGFALTCCIVSFLNLDYKLRFDDHHKAKTANVYRINSVFGNEDENEKWGITPLALGSSINQDLKDIGAIIRLHGGNGMVKVNGKTFSEQIHYSDMELFDAFNFSFMLGRKPSASNFEAVVLSQSTSFKYFGNENSVGKELKIIDSFNREKTFIVAGVTDNVPENTSIRYDLIVPISSSFERDIFPENDWRFPNYITTFLKLSSDYKPSEVDELLERYVATYNEFRPESEMQEFYIQPFKELAFTSDIDLPGWVRGRQLNRNAVGFLVGITSILSILILITACFNFTNTSLAFSSSRLREIGIRKVIGGTRSQLVKQFMVENLVLCILSIAIGLMGASLLIDGYNGLFDQQLDLRYLFTSRVMIFLLLLPVATAVFAGIYPALKVSVYQPVEILKGKNRYVKLGWLSKFLLVAQFSISCFAIIGGIVLTQNASYQASLDFGYDMRKVAVTEVKNLTEFAIFRNELENDPSIENVAGSSQVVGQSNVVATKLTIEDLDFTAQHLSVGANYLSTLGIGLVSGRHFTAGSSKDLSKAVMINQTMAKELRIDGDALNRQIFIEEKPYLVVGVVEDHKEFGLSQVEPPCIFTLADETAFRYLSANAKDSPSAQIASSLKATWYKVNPDVPYKGFLQEMLIYKQLGINRILRNLCLFLAIATLIMSAAGFFSIVSLSLVKRTREIGIRKVFGASINQMIRLILNDFTRFIFISFLIGSVLSYLAIYGLLFNSLYVFHIPFGIGSFLLALIVMLFVPGMTVGLKVYKAANTNPSETLKCE